MTYKQLTSHKISQSSNPQTEAWGDQGVLHRWQLIWSKSWKMNSWGRKGIQPKWNSGMGENDYAMFVQLAIL